MRRSSFLKIGGLAAGTMLLSSKQLLAALPADPWAIKMLTPDVGVFTEKGGTILFYLSADGVLVIDAEFPEQAGHLITEMKKKTAKPFGLLINTHHHADHSSGNIAFKDLVPHVLAHENSLKNQIRVAKAEDADGKQLYPDQTFQVTHQRNFGGESLKLYYFGPAHTDGDALTHLEHSNIVHMGDLINNRRYPYIDRSAGASITNWVAVLDKTPKTFDKNTTYVFGHASPGFDVYGKTEDINKMKDYFEKLIVFSNREIKAGKSKEEFLKNTSIPGVTEWVGDGIERSLTAAWEEFSVGS